ncbi:MAG: L,D-transpeptidase [Pseudomonadota bacterium]
MSSTPVLRTAALTLIAAALCIAIAPAPSQAQYSYSLFDWGQGWSENARPRVPRMRVVAFPRRIAPGQVIASFVDRRLYFVHKRGRAIAYPIATPRRRSAWEGVLRVTKKRTNPPWTPTPSMRRENPHLPAFVPGGHPRNPMGTHALYLGSTLYRIHGTDAPWTIGQPISKGCIRMLNRHVADLYSRVPIGTKVTITYRSFMQQRQGYYW